MTHLVTSLKFTSTLIILSHSLTPLLLFLSQPHGLKSHLIKPRESDSSAHFMS